MRLTGCFLLLAAALPGSAANIELRSWAMNLNGTVYRMGIDPLPALLPCDLILNDFDTATGVGSIVARFTSPGDYYISFFFDHEILGRLGRDQDMGVARGGPLQSGITWELDDWRTGNIWTNFENGRLDNRVFGLQPILRNRGFGDVALAAGAQFTLAEKHIALINFYMRPSMPLAGHWAGISDWQDIGWGIGDHSMYSLVAYRSGDQASAPEPGSAALAALGVMTICCLRLRRQ